MTDDEKVDVEEFIAFFPEVELPFIVYDTTLTRKVSDSMLIGRKNFTQFVPDSVITKVFGAKGNPKIYPLGRVQENKKDQYLFVRAVEGSRRAAYLICFDKDQKYLNAMTLLQTGKEKYAKHYAALDRKFQITTYREKPKTGDEVNYKRNIYVYNAGANEFTLILTEPNVEMIENLINPIDTLPRKNKLAGDYLKNKENIISFRDGKNDSELLFWVHFEKDNGQCVGELKGTAKMLSAKKAIYKEAGNPCTLEFTFNTGNVVMKEVEGCGSYRDIKCFFEGTYPRKKEPKPKSSKKKK